jgi:lysophospholipase L1-like esterase
LKLLSFFPIKSFQNKNTSQKIINMHNTPSSLKICLISDSLSLPRIEELCSSTYEETYPYILQTHLQTRLCPRVLILDENGRRRLTSHEAVKELEEKITLKHPHILILHLGIVDCAPRVFMPLENRLVTSIRPLILKKLVLQFVNRNRRKIIQLFPNRVYIRLNQFKKNMEKVITRCLTEGVQKIFIVNIISPPDQYEYRSPGLQKNVRAYNRVLAELQKGNRIKLLDINSEAQKYFESETILNQDGIHLNNHGHKILAEMLETQLIEAINQISGQIAV